MNQVVFSPKNISLSFPWNLPKKLTGPVVIFDIISATFNMIYLKTHAKEVYLVTKENVFDALKLLPEAKLIGETNDPDLYEKLKDKFIAPNSPTEITKLENITNETIVLITNNGTHTVNETVNKGASPVIVGHYANIHAFCQFLMDPINNFSNITLVPSGGRENVFKTNPELKEDLYCAEAAQDILQGINPNFPELFANTEVSVKLQYPNDGFPRRSTFDILFGSLDQYPIIPICERQANGLLKIVNGLY